jgi:hypothetical protein
VKEAANLNSRRVGLDHDAFVDLLESIEYFLKGVDIYTRIPTTPAVDEIVFKILVKLLLTIALATKELQKRGCE